jgi:Ca-activated chloride channel family protein
MPRLAALFVCLIALALTGCHLKPPADPNTLVAQGSLSNRFVRAGQASPVAARLLIEARAGERSARPPVNLALVVDTSGSMEGRPIDDARAASKVLLSALRPGDRIAVVAFGSTTEVLLPSTLMEDADLGKLQRRIDAMKALGTTDMAGGLRAGLSEVQQHLVADGVNRVILLGDGDPNEAPPVKSLAAEAGAQQISITALGLGPDYNETLMGEVAQISGGRFHYVEDSTKVAAFFDAEIVRLNRIYAKNATVELVPGPMVQIDKVIGHPGGGRARISIPIGDLSYGEQQELIVKLTAPAHRAGAAVELFDAILRFEDVRAGVTVERRIFFGAHAAARDEDLKEGRNEAVERAAAKAEAAAATLEAIDAARRGALEKARENLKKGASYGFADEGDLALDRALPSVAPMPAAPPPLKRDSEVVRKAHDKAVNVFQAH